MTDERVTVVGGGLAGCECACQLADRGVRVLLREMRPEASSPAHRTSGLAELVCSNSLKSTRIDSAAGLLKEELRRMGSVLLDCAERAAVPAGGALAVDRDLFSRHVEEAIASRPGIEVVRGEVTSIPDGPCVIAAGRRFPRPSSISLVETPFRFSTRRRPSWTHPPSTGPLSSPSRVTERGTRAIT